MPRTNRVNRPYVRKSKVSNASSIRATLDERLNGVDVPSAGARLSALAGGTDRPVVEQLERRQLLFSLTVTQDDVDPQTGIGTVQAYFGYVIPYIAPTSQIQDEQAPQARNENFNDEGAGIRFTNTFFLESGILLRHNIAPAVDIRIDPPGADITERWLRVNINGAGEFFSFQLFNDGMNPTTPVAARSARFDVRTDAFNQIGDSTGLPTDRVQLDLFFNQQVVGTFTGAALRALIQGGNPANGVGTVVINAPANVAGFDTIRITALASSNPLTEPFPEFQVDNLSFSLPRNRFATLIENRIFGAAAFLSGPVGATVNITDLYGREMRNTIALGIPPNANEIVLVDLNSDGVPDFNDGIGALRFSGTDSRTAFTMFGATIMTAQMPDPNADFNSQGFALTVIDNVEGLYNEFESAGFGYIIVPQQGGMVQVRGLPPAGGSVIIGSPFVRNNANAAAYNPAGTANQNFQITTGFTNPDQGIFVNGGASISSVYIHGIVHGSSRFTGFVDRLAVGNLYGSVTVEGDLGALIVASDAGQWVVEPNVNPNFQFDPIVKTNNQLIVGRTVGEIAIGGRNLMDITIVGDVNSPTTRPARDVYTYYEKEFLYGVDPGQPTIGIIRATLNNTGYVTRQATALTRTIDQGLVFNQGFMRNDAILAAEFIGGPTSGVRIVGDLSGRDPISPGEDAADVFAFAADGTQDVVFESNGAVGYLRVMDQFGRTIAAPNRRFGIAGARFSDQFRFRPDGPGLYYLVVTDATGDNPNPGAGASGYSIAVSGLAPVVLGSYRTAGGSGNSTALQGTLANTLTVLNGSVGALRIGTGWVSPDGAEDSPVGVYNTADGADDSMAFQGGTYTIPGNLYNITTGSDIGSAQGFAGRDTVSVSVGGNFGTLYTGLAPAAGGPQNVAEGDVNFFNLSVGGSIASINITGGVGMDQDNTGDPRAIIGVGSVNITTGTRGGRGDIGMIRVGFHVGGDCMTIRTSPGSIIGGILVSQDAYNDGDDRSGVYDGARGLPIITGAGSDVRFVDMPRIDLFNSDNAFFAITETQSITLVDDGGARVRISITGGGFGATGSIRAFPIDGSQGVAIGDVDVDLLGGATLRITGISPGGAGGASGGSIGIGRIRLRNAVGSSVIIDGNVEIDVYRIEQIGGGDGGGIVTIRNSTPGGDFVAIDVAGLGTLEVTRGNLGSTQVPAWGPKLIGPYLGLAPGLSEGVGTPMGAITANVSDDDFNGNVYRPINDDSRVRDNAYMDDMGFPLDGFLNGVVVRGGAVASVTVAGSVGDVILQGAGGVAPDGTPGPGTLVSLRANSDRSTPLGGFDGIVGNIYAFDIVFVHVGDGLAEGAQSPLATTSIFAADDITEITNSGNNGSVISGPINATNVQPVDGPEDTLNGIGRVTITNGRFHRAYIGSQNLDGFWNSVLYADDNISLGNINLISGSNTDFFRSEARAIDLLNFTLTNGFFDASTIALTGRAADITAQGYRNSTLLGTTLEFHENAISTAGDLRKLSAVGDISDLTIDVVGSVTDSIRAVNITRSTIDVNNRLSNLTATNSIRAASVTTGELPTVSAGDSIVASTFFVSGLINSITAGNRIQNTNVAVTGPSGAINNINGRTLVSGTFSATGPIGTINSADGDVVATIVTTTSRGNVNVVSARRDVDIRTDISGNLTRITAGRHIGSRTNEGVILVRGNLQTATATSGQLYSDLRVGGDITGTVTVNQVLSKPERDLLGRGSIIAFGRITGVNITGDFNGDIISFSGGLGPVSITNGSFLPGNTIAAYDGTVASVIITNGNLYGNIHADNDITLVRVAAGADGIFGDVGVNPAFSQFTGYDANRNQLPVGVQTEETIQGPRITAGKKITNFVVTNGSVFETYFHAGQTIQTININGDVRNDSRTSGTGSVFAAGDTITDIVISGSVENAAFIAGLVDFGSDGRAGGRAGAADRIKSGTLTKVIINGSAKDAVFSAGLTAGMDGIYNTADDRVAPGLSRIETVTVRGSVTNVSAFGDALGAVNNDARIIKGGTNLPLANPEFDDGQGTPGTAFSRSRTFDFGGGQVTLNFTGPGSAFFNEATGKVTLRGTTSASSLTVTSTLATLSNFDIVTNDEASLGTLRVTPALAGDSDILIDGSVGTLALGNFSGTGDIIIGGDINAATFATFSGGFLSTANINTLTISGDYGAANSAIFNEVRIQALNVNTLRINGAARGAISVDRITNTFSVGFAERAAFRFGHGLGTFTAGTIRQTVLSAGDNISNINIAGEAFDSSILAGIDLGTDSAFGGAGSAADRITTGTIGNVTIGGNFRESDIVAGYYRGADGFFGTADDTVAPGLGTINSISIAGSSVGSTRLSESYLIAASGTLGTVSIGGSPFSGQLGNFATEFSRGVLAPIPIQVVDVAVTSAAGVFSANLQFNQPIDASTLAKSVSVSEVRGSGEIEIRLIEGIDYTIGYNSGTNTANFTFSRSLTQQDVPQIPGQPGPGIYRFKFDQATLRGKSLGSLTDGNGNGFSEPGDSISVDTFVGDVGDKLVAETAFSGGHRVDFYAPGNLDIVLDNNFTSDGVADANRVVTIRGTIGDHPDNDTNNFRFASDIDVYRVTLQAGQILRLGAMQGAALLAPLTLVTPDGFAAPLALPTQPRDIFDLTTPQAFLIKQTGAYHIVVGSADTYNQPGVVPNLDSVPAGVGDYNFTLEIFDDGDSGFSSPDDSGNGVRVVPAPNPISFAGPDGQFGTADDVTEIVLGGFTFTHNRGQDGLPNTADDLVTGENGSGIVTTTSGTGRQTASINAAIGPAGHAGIPTQVTSDVDIFHLNNRLPIAAGSKIRVSVVLTESGSDLGSASTVGQELARGELPQDRRGSVQFGVFQTSASTGVDDGLLYFSPTDFSPNGGTPNRLIADNGQTKYGYDSNGDFYIEFIAGDRLDLPGTPSSYAVYVQGVYNTDYRIDVTMDGTGQIIRQRQNFLLETNGGIVNWLEAGGVETRLGPFNTSALGFSGLVINNQSADQYTLTQLVSSLNAVFQGSFNTSGFDVHFSTNPADFEFQPFSTIFLTSSNDPLTMLFDNLFFGGADFIRGQVGTNTFFSTQPFGASEHSDPLNADLQDEAVVFTPSFGLLGFNPSRADVDRFVQSLTGAVGRRAGELLGLRISANNTGTTFDFQASNSVIGQPGPGRSYAFPTGARDLSAPGDNTDDTDFFLGRQDSRSLLDKILGRI